MSGVCQVAPCFERRCKHWIGMRKISGDKIYNICEAFPDGIPIDIVLGKNFHFIRTPEQKNNLTFEEEGQ